MQQAIPPVWLLTDKQTGNPSYLRFQEGESRWVVGPFIYTTEQNAQQAAVHLSFIPKKTEGVKGAIPALACTRIEGVGLVEGILTRFDPSGSDVFALDEGFLPLTESGASWVDGLTERNDWRPLFGGEASTEAPWLTAVLKQVSDVLGVEMIQASMDKEDIVHARAGAARRKIEEHVGLHIEPEVPSLFGQLPKATTFLVRTHGMEKLGRPDLEMVGVQPLFLGDAMAMVAGWAAYSLDHPVRLGTSLMGAVNPVTVILQVVPGDKVGVLRLVIDQVIYVNPAHQGSNTLH